MIAYYSCRNSRLARHSDFDALGDSSEQRTFASSNAGNPVPTTASVKNTKDELWTMTSFAWICSSRLKPVVPNPQANKKCKNHFDTYGRHYLLQPYPICNLFLYGRISFCWHQFKRRKNQVVKDLLSWVKFKTFLWRSLSDSRASMYTTWSCIK